MSPAHPEGAQPDPTTELSVGKRTAVMVLWCSFLVASAGTMFCFAFVDPAPLGTALLTFGLEAGRMTLYSLGFLFFWALCAASGALTLWMSRPQ